MVVAFFFFLRALMRVRKLGKDLEVLTKKKKSRIPKISEFAEANAQIHSDESAELLLKAESACPSFILTFRVLALLLVVSGITLFIN